RGGEGWGARAAASARRHHRPRGDGLAATSPAGSRCRRARRGWPAPLRGPPCVAARSGARSGHGAFHGRLRPHPARYLPPAPPDAGRAGPRPRDPPPPSRTLPGGPPCRGRRGGRPARGRGGGEPLSMPEASAPAVALEGVAKKFSEFVALRGISLSIAPGEFICFLGPSGCGKTTLLRIIAGLERQNAGTVRM